MIYRLYLLCNIDNSLLLKILKIDEKEQQKKKVWVLKHGCATAHG
jgi:hypothetical protein